MARILKVIFVVTIFLSFQKAYGQFKKGTYTIISDTTSYFEGSLFSRLTFKKNKTFVYEYRASISCFLWYDSHGQWAVNHDTLTLTDTVISHHPVINFTNYKKTDDNKLCLLLKTKEGKPLQGIKVLYIFKYLNDTVSGFTSPEGKFEADTRNRTAAKKEGKYRSVDDAEIWVTYINKSGQDQTTNSFSDLSAEIECVIDDEAKNEAVLRTTIYKIEGNNLVYQSQRYDKENVRPGRYLFGNFRFGKE